MLRNISQNQLTIKAFFNCEDLLSFPTVQVLLFPFHCVLMPFHGSHFPYNYLFYILSLFSLKILHTRERAFSLGCRWTISFPHAHASDIPPPRALEFFLAVYTHTLTHTHTHMHPCKRSLSLFCLSHAFTQTLIYSPLHTNMTSLPLSFSHSLSTIRTSSLFLLDHARHIPSLSLSHSPSLSLTISHYLSFSLSLSQHPNSFLLLASHPPLLPSIPSESCFLNQTFKER